MLENLVRIERRENGNCSEATDLQPSFHSVHDYVVYGTDFVVHPRIFGSSFEIFNLEDVKKRINASSSEFGMIPNCYRIVETKDGSGKAAQLYLLSLEYRRALEVQERAIADMLMS